MKTPFKALLIAGLTTIFMFGATSTAFAQQTSGEDAAILTGTLLGYSTTTTLLSSPITTVGVVLLVVLSDNDDEQVAQLERYMRNNAIALQHDLHLGGGETATDLASAFNVPSEHEAEFAEILYENRDDLAPLAEPGQVDRTAAETFGRIVIEEMLEDDAMSAHLLEKLG